MHATDQHSALEPVHDPLHGPIDVEDAFVQAPGGPGEGVIRRLLKAPMLTRLRHVRQLGFASLGFPAADHTRFAHALGTMQVMRLLCDKIIDSGSAYLEAGGALIGSFELFRQMDVKSEAFQNAFVTHLLVAALLEDVGELPFAQATELVIWPLQEEHVHLGEKLRCNTRAWGAKQVFTMRLISEALDQDAELASVLDFELLTFLITGVMPSGKELVPGLMRLRHTVDGVIDADRLDYVFRDAHHTIGSHSSASAVIDSLVCYDDTGPVFSDPEPVVAFLTDYAHLWSAVYFSAQNRFRIVVLATLLQTLRTDRDLRTTAGLAHVLENGMGLHEFSEFDDRALFRGLQELFKAHHSHERPRVLAALRVLLEDSQRADYDALWVTPGDADGALDGELETLFEGRLFFDAFFNAREHILYSSKDKPIKIRSRLLTPDGTDLPLDKCDGPFSALLNAEWRFTKRQNGILVFFPSGDDRRSYVAEIAERRSFSLAVSEFDPLRGAYPSDTRNRPEFKQPSLFISYEMTDGLVLDRVCEHLFHQRQQYYYLRKADCARSYSTKDASIDCARKAGAALIFLSKAYLAKYAQGAINKDGNIWAEISILVERKANEGLPIRFLTVGGYDEVKDCGDFPIAELTGRDPAEFTPTMFPSVGISIRSATSKEIAEMVGHVVEGFR